MTLLVLQPGYKKCVASADRDCFTSLTEKHLSPSSVTLAFDYPWSWLSKSNYLSAI